MSSQQNIARFFEEKLILLKQQFASFAETSDFSTLDTASAEIQEMLDITKNIAEISREVRFLSGVIASLRKENSKLKQMTVENSQTEALQKQWELLKNQNQELLCEIEELQDKSRELEDLKEEHEQMLEDLQKLRDTGKGNKNLGRRLESLKDERDELKGEMEKLQKKNDELSERILAIDENNRELIEANMQLQDQIDGVQEQESPEPVPVEEKFPEIEETAFISLGPERAAKKEEKLPSSSSTMVIPLDGPASPQPRTKELLTQEQVLAELDIDKKQLDRYIEEKKLNFSTSEDGVRMFRATELENLKGKKSLSRLRQLFKDRIEKED